LNQGQPAQIDPSQFAIQPGAGGFQVPGANGAVSVPRRYGRRLGSGISAFGPRILGGGTPQPAPTAASQPQTLLRVPLDQALRGPQLSGPLAQALRGPQVPETLAQPAQTAPAAPATSQGSQAAPATQPSEVTPTTSPAQQTAVYRAQRQEIRGQMDALKLEANRLRSRSAQPGVSPQQRQRLLSQVQALESQRLQLQQAGGELSRLNPIIDNADAQRRVRESEQMFRSALAESAESQIELAREATAIGDFNRAQQLIREADRLRQASADFRVNPSAFVREPVGDPEAVALRLQQAQAGAADAIRRASGQPDPAVLSDAQRLQDARDASGRWPVIERDIGRPRATPN
jgi:hypothetical protein